MANARGFTLLELLVTLLLATMLMAIGIPALRTLVLDARMTGSVNAMIHGIHLARQQAQVQGRPVAICPSRDGRHCTREDDWAAGWIVYSDRSQYESRPPADRNRVLLSAGPWHDGHIVANRSAFVFRPFEIRSTNGTLLFCDSRGRRHARAIIVSPTGRPRVATSAVGARIRCHG